MTEADIVFLNDLKSAVLQGIHQCNNHLAIILSNSELILALQNEDATTKKTESTITRVALLTDLFAQLSQLYTVDLKAEKINLKSILHHEISHYSELAAREGIQMLSQIDCEGEVNLRSHVFKLLIHLLFRNAVSATKSQPEKQVHISAVFKNGNLTMDISNSGSAPEDLNPEFVFSSFFTAKKASTCDFLGAVKTLTRLLGGQTSFTRIEQMNHVKTDFYF